MLRRRARDGDPPAVRGPVGVARGAGVEPVPDAARDDPELAVGQRGRLDEAGQRLDQVDVDQLARRRRAGRGGRAPSSRRRWPTGPRRRRPGRRGAASAARRAGRSRGRTRSWPRPACRSPGRSLAGPPPPYPLTWSMTSCGVRRVHRLVVEAPPGQRAGAVVHHEHVAHVEQPVEQLLARRRRAGRA